MSATLTTIASVTAADLTAADAFGGFVALLVGVVSFLAISGLALSMTIGASKSPGTMAITGGAGLLSVIVAIGLYVTLTGTHAHRLEECPVATWDRLGGMMALVLGIVGVLALGGLAVVMTMGAFNPSKQPVTSWPQQQEQQFFAFDNRASQSQSRAWVYSIVAGVFVFVFSFGVYQGVTPDIKDISKDMNMSNLTKKSKTEAPAPTPTPAPKAEAPAPAATPTPAPKAEEPAPKQ
jgi:hypothetical protein